MRCGTFRASLSFTAIERQTTSAWRWHDVNFAWKILSVSVNTMSRIVCCSVDDESCSLRELITSTQTCTLACLGVVERRSAARELDSVETMMAKNRISHCSHVSYQNRLSTKIGGRKNAFSIFRLNESSNRQLVKMGELERRRKKTLKMAQLRPLRQLDRVEFFMQNKKGKKVPRILASSTACSKFASLASVGGTKRAPTFSIFPTWCRGWDADVRAMFWARPIFFSSSAPIHAPPLSCCKLKLSLLIFILMWHTCLTVSVVSRRSLSQALSELCAQMLIFCL